MYRPGRFGTKVFVTGRQANAGELTVAHLVKTFPASHGTRVPTHCSRILPAICSKVCAFVMQPVPVERHTSVCASRNYVAYLTMLYQE
jgi:hypothetical protein